ncbi:MAG TPA: 4Fe-4S dicluster domain-containing protein [Chloroflexus aurantiacus]|uniref:4Fe-4S ferredoxin iron-sulfur binding domain protein n=1 Tax=Chloroflexus aurantiacus (strain ATCC 29366 / DSM 635 / J-10-fl) TaxID=324602 RepID=A9WED6_CHLAA|nr:MULTISPECIES: 4Fe-4S dicluster domain-containing protein [Chloroflexus]ABY35198.1 4Fe-4S ferredoxin iron-sulfur binding domain protein [Chloroflexus aurantiacus J-10-fl]RMG53307.1 MAG: 4Fe-4S dicluster domain-containing protein [Chloroflexota bacterium]GIV92402.1 MAG: 4Fe-4S ferredoxin [Chloroflexus sp.]HBW68629.1 4Fe-4S dicluster domain-containing protein [Chloroflexus aurantiacus]
MTAPPFEIEIPRGRVIEVQRDDTRVRRGSGLLRGMAVIWKHWKESFRLNRSYRQIHGTFTIQYPEERPRIPETYRNMPILLYDDETGHELCTSCFQCERICPPQVIHMTQAKDPATGKPVPAVAEFIIEYDACMSCGFCAEVCPFDAIKMDHEFELSTDDHSSLTVHKAQLNRPISYYEKIAPTMWAEVRESALKKLQGNIRRRPDVIGIAPHLTERIAARRAELAAQAPASPPEAATPAAPAEARKLSPEEKAAKLAAIRAAKAAQTGDGTSPAEGASPTAPAPADDKAAKLAAIRAANAAKKAAEGAAPAPTGDAPAAPTTPADEKAARLAAIRAANAAKRKQAEEQARDGSGEEA